LFRAVRLGRHPLSHTGKGSEPDKDSLLDVTKYLVTNNPVMSDVVTFTQALGDRTRWRIVRLVMDEALCVCELADILEMPQSSVSSHVQILRKADLLESEKCGKWLYFRIEESFLGLVRTLDAAFSAGKEAVAKEDARRARLRLAERAGSCCPGPVTLTPRKINTQPRTTKAR